jgi:hypothetical protein
MLPWNVILLPVRPLTNKALYFKQETIIRYASFILARGTTSEPPNVSADPLSTSRCSIRYPQYTKSRSQVTLMALHEHSECLNASGALWRGHVFLISRAKNVTEQVIIFELVGLTIDGAYH